MAVTVNFSQGERLEKQISLADITTSQNPRHSHRHLLELFHTKGAHTNPPELRAEYIAEIDNNFPHIRQRAESIKYLGQQAGNIRRGQLEAVTLRSFRAKDGEEYVERYGICQGECRTLAWGLIEAETGEAQTVRAVIEKLTLEEAFERALAENLEREDMSPNDVAASIHEMLTVRINPKTVKPMLDENTPNPLYDPAFPKGRPYTMKEVADKVKRDYHWVRSRASLVFLPDADKRQIDADHKEGKRDLTRFCKKAGKLATALKAKAKEDGVPVEALLEQVAGTENLENPDQGVATENNPAILTVQPERRRHVRSLKEVVALFDATPLENVARLQALAEVMGIDEDGDKALRIALDEREKRAEEAELRSGRIADRQARRKQTA
jgi:hypothetical protein